MTFVNMNSIGADCMDMIMDYKYSMEHKERMVRLMSELKTQTSLRSCFIRYMDYECGEGEDGDYCWSDFKYLEISINSYSAFSNTYYKDGVLTELSKGEYVEYYMNNVDKRICEESLNIYELNHIELFYKNGEFKDLGDFDGFVIIDN